MPLLGIVVLVFLFILAIVTVIPIVASAISVAILGRKAKLQSEETLLLGFGFYLIMSIYSTLYMLSVAEGGIGTIVGAIVMFLFWPIGMGFAFLGTASDSGEARMLFALGYVTIQLIAVILIIRRAKRETDQ